jgi:hypothetical protein
MNANDTLREHSCSDHFYQYITINISEGVIALAQKFECFWFIDIIASYQPQLKQEEFQVWKLIKNEDDSAIVTCDDGNGRILKKQRIEYTDFKADTATVWVEFGTGILPSEH